MILYRLNRHLGFSNLARLINEVSMQSRSPISMVGAGCRKNKHGGLTKASSSIKGHGQSNLRMRLFLLTIVMLVLHEVLPALANVQYGGCFARSCRVFWLYVDQVINFCVRWIINTVFVCICTTILVQMESFTLEQADKSERLEASKAPYSHSADVFEYKWLQRMPL